MRASVRASMRVQIPTKTFTGNYVSVTLCSILNTTRSALFGNCSNASEIMSQSSRKRIEPGGRGVYLLGDE